ncbi:MAG TPA: hypothetical protein VKI44_31615 [Acetobacteraceae bacterium]|nr:hypothetical protein [Acetobacteraceae bacterium]
MTKQSRANDPQVFHCAKLLNGFTSRYNVGKLVYFEEFREVNDAIAREKQIKACSRRRKVMVIDNVNPDWRDLSGDLI